MILLISLSEPQSGEESLRLLRSTNKRGSQCSVFKVKSPEGQSSFSYHRIFASSLPCHCELLSLSLRAKRSSLVFPQGRKGDCFGNDTTTSQGHKKGSLRAKRSSPAAFFAVASEAKQSEIASPDEQTRLAMTGERAKKQARNDQERGEKTGSQ